MKKLTNEEVIEKLKLNYGTSLDYSKVQYVNSRSYITLICHKHGEFQQYANNALLGKGGCPKCKLGISNQQEFINAAVQKFKNKFSYDKTKFINLSTKVIITCPIHGDFEIIPRNFLLSQYGCKKCFYQSKIISKEQKIKISKEDEIKQNEINWKNNCNIIYNNKYDYSKVNYVNSKTKVCIICPEHGEFWQNPNAHKSGRGCPKCARIVRSDKTKLSQDEFEQRANKKWNNKYTYDKYISMHQPIKVKCPIHGFFYVTPHNHLKNCGCPICSMSSGELIISEYLNLKNVKYIPQFQIHIDKSINPSGFAKIDFYLPDYNTFIEYNGEQHYMPIKHFGGEIKFKQQIERDNYVKEYCKRNNIQLLEISYKLSSEQINNKLFNLISNGKI